MITQLRPFYTPAELEVLYAETYDHTKWADHIERVEYTARVLDRFAEATGARTLADLSCGDAAIADMSTHPWERVTLGDLTAGHEVVGPIESTVTEIEPVDMFLCSETLEHVRDPLSLLKRIRAVARHLLLSTPCGERDDGNEEHYWGWDQDGVADLLGQAGFSGAEGELFRSETRPFYTFQVWQAS